MAENDGLQFSRKYRPSTLKSYIGNEGIKKKALKALEAKTRPQIVFLHGDSGCGKTTFGRILAKEYICQNRNVETGACGVCPNCIAADDYIATGSTDSLSIMNIKEVNMSEQNGKNDLNDVFEEMQIPSFDDGWKIYLFDECHKATESLQNAMLKIVEEPPEHVLMIFCTTNPEKMLDTFINRCDLILKVEKPRVKEIAGLLKGICEVEDIPWDYKGLELIANRSERVIRTSLKHLQSIYNEYGHATYEFVSKTFKEVSSTIIVKFFNSLKNRDTLAFVNCITDVKKQMELTVFLEEVKNFVRRGIYVINGVEQDGMLESELSVYRGIFGSLSVSEVGSVLNTLLSFSRENLELEMLMWGYSGLVAEQNKPSNDINSLILGLENEIEKESKSTSKRLEEKHKEEYDKGIENANNLMDAVDIESILAMGATLVEEN